MGGPPRSRSHYCQGTRSSLRRVQPRRCRSRWLSASLGETRAVGGNLRGPDTLTTGHWHPWGSREAPDPPSPLCPPPPGVCSEPLTCGVREETQGGEEDWDSNPSSELKRELTSIGVFPLPNPGIFTADAEAASWPAMDFPSFQRFDCKVKAHRFSFPLKNKDSTPLGSG